VKDEFSTTSEFRDEMLRGMTRLESKMQDHTATLERIEDRQMTGEACIAGAKHTSRLDSLEKTRDEMWEKLASLSRPARKAVAVGGLGGISLVALVEIIKGIWSAIHGSPTP